jgi:hypothetical protein
LGQFEIVLQKHFSYVLPDRPPARLSRPLLSSSSILLEMEKVLAFIQNLNAAPNAEWEKVTIEKKAELSAANTIACFTPEQLWNSCGMSLNRKNDNIF